MILLARFLVFLGLGLVARVGVILWFKLLLFVILFLQRVRLGVPKSFGVFFRRPRLVQGLSIP